MHGIYQRNKPTAKWHLVSIAITAEAANLELDTKLKEAKRIGIDQAEVISQWFNTSFAEDLPETLKDITPQKPLFN